jgi:hypothetical protein
LGEMSGKAAKAQRRQGRTKSISGLPVPAF